MVGHLMQSDCEAAAFYYGRVIGRLLLKVLADPLNVEVVKIIDKRLKNGEPWEHVIADLLPFVAAELRNMKRPDSPVSSKE